MVRCSFCDISITPGTGIMYVKTSGKILHFCGSKCEKNMIQLKRKSTKVKWIVKKKKVKEK